MTGPPLSKRLAERGGDAARSFRRATIEGGHYANNDLAQSEASPLGRQGRGEPWVPGARSSLIHGRGKYKGLHLSREINWMH